MILHEAEDFGDLIAPSPGADFGAMQRTRDDWESGAERSDRPSEVLLRGLTSLPDEGSRFFAVASASYDVLIPCSCWTTRGGEFEGDERAGSGEHR